MPDPSHSPDAIPSPWRRLFRPEIYRSKLYHSAHPTFRAGWRFIIRIKPFERNFMVMKIFDNEFVLCDLDDSLPVLRHYWKNAPSGEQFKVGLLKILEEYKTLKQSYKGLAWLADTTQLGELDEKTEAWLVEEWEDMLFAKAGVKIHAVILGESIFADYPMENFKSDAEQKFQDYNVHLGVFSSQEEAYTWIKEQQPLIVN